MNTVLGYLASQNKGIAKHSQRITDPHPAKTLYRKFETNIPRNETARPQFLQACTCEGFFYIYMQQNRWTDCGNI
jgi:hypothetical protein